MVNEMKKPTGFDDLGERLLSSNRQLQAMQDEHRQLLQEMEVLRQRAADLSRLNEQFEIEQMLNITAETATTSNERTASENASNIGVDEATAAVINVEHTNNTEVNEINLNAPNNLQEESDITNINSTLNSVTETTDSNDDNNEHNHESTEYVQQKINEIALLKSQFKRVQNMIKTTKLIENHLSSAPEVLEENIKKNNAKTINEENEHVQFCTQEETQPIAHTHLDENQELLTAMFNMFTEFNADLRNQAQSLKAERERIKGLKEEILKRRQK